MSKSDAVAAPAVAHQSFPEPRSRREFLGLARAAAAASATVASIAAPRAIAASTDTSDELIYMSATKLAGLIRAKKVSASEAVEAYIARQLAVNDMLNAVVMNSYARARAEAKAADKAAARGEWMGPLHGVPMTIKDSLDTVGVITTGATYGRQQFVPTKDATVVARVRRAGAILLGKTNTPEFTLGGLGGISAASNLLYGSSHNPYDLSRSTAGSSGGAGAIVAAGGAAFDIGSDWGGSIRGPAHNNGIAGIKPTSVRVPRTGHIVDYGGIFDLWQQLGPMTRRVEDLSLITPIISGPDFHDASCAPVPWVDPLTVELKKLKVAYCVDNGATGQGATDDDTKKVVRQVAAWLNGATASVAEAAPTEVLKTLAGARTKLSSGDGYAYYKRLAEKWHTENISPQRKAQMADPKVLSTAEMVEAWEVQDDCKSRLLAWMKDYDVFICPVSGKPAQPIDVPGGAMPGGSGAGGGWPYTGVFNCTGWPVVVVRAGASADGKLPIGVQIVCAPWREDICLAVAAFVEAQSGGWQPPPI
ncbi:MAG: amidase [Nevskia sp.]|nr:amidase [Nevskia sp.]